MHSGMGIAFSIMLPALVAIINVRPHTISTARRAAATPNLESLLRKFLREDGWIPGIDPRNIEQAGGLYPPSQAPPH